jgi:integrase
MRRKWLGGYVRQGKKGNVFVIERWIHGTHFHVSTKCRTERAALKELERFEVDPSGYRPQAREAARAVVVTPELVAEYEAWQRDSKKTTPSHARDCARYMEAWMHVFAGRDVRGVSLHDDIKPALDRWKTARHGRIVALKGFAAWLRREKGALQRHQDPTLDLQVPPSRPEKLRRRKAIAREAVEATLPHLPAAVRDVALVLAATGLHVSELRRFTEEGELFAATADGAVANLSVQHKTGRLHVVALPSQDVLDAAVRLKHSGMPGHSVLWFALRDACDAARVPRWNLGSLRHSVATWLAEAGVPLHAISEQLGHRDPRTTADFYRDMGHGAKALPIPRMRLVR